MQKKNYSGYRSYSYLEAVEDYKAFALAQEIGRVEPYMEYVEYIALGPDALFGDYAGLHHLLAGPLSIGAAHKGNEFEEVPYVQGLENPAEVFPNIVRWLVKHGYGDEDIGKIIGGNIMRMLKEVWWR